jgi:hypothetical protein
MWFVRRSPQSQSPRRHERAARYYQPLNQVVVTEESA